MTTFVARNLLPKNVVSARQPEARKIRLMLANLAKCRNARLVKFCVNCGETRFKIDNDLTAYQLSEDIMDTIAIRPMIRQPAKITADKSKNGIEKKTAKERS